MSEQQSEFIQEVLDLANHEANEWFETDFLESVLKQSLERELSENQWSAVLNIEEKLQESIGKWEAKYG